MNLTQKNPEHFLTKINHRRVQVLGITVKNLLCFQSVASNQDILFFSLM